ncbi:VMAP-C domain-containing protein [Spirillospora sp. NBC_01491]|uniref:VMAP-C domain-containing protein n=1 Tax=Spirillospora sp. NBC_01491 TaxID=2976007 RepID=UPI002E374E3F|nr:trypsin-like peptidase domain-containing protein [Spirillospora sp. NBC_01491]
MDDWQWRAWVGPPDGGRLGAAFLIAPDLLLTCAHTVAGLDAARVGFPGLIENLPAAVVRPGGWERPGDPGDVAVLRLAAPVGLRCARPAGPEALHASAGPASFGRRALRVCGFPRRADGDERYATVTTGPDMVLRHEWWQLRTGPGEQLEEGYSGSAVYDPATGEVIGMVTDAEFGGDDGPGGEGGLGRMLPVTVIRRYWEELDDHLPLAWLTVPARRELRALLADAGFTAPMAAGLEEITGRRAHRPFRSAWDSVRHVAEGWPEDRLARYLRAMARHLPEAGRRDLAEWSGRHLAAAAPAPARAGHEAAGLERSGPASIIVRLERATLDRAFDVTVHTWIDGAEGPAQDTVRVPENRVRAAVEAGVARARAAVVGRDWMIEFAVPESWLSKPFEEWYIDRAHGMRMRLYPVVVRDVERLWPGSIRRDQAHRRWRLLNERGRIDPQGVRCETPSNGSGFSDWLEADTGLCVLVYGTRPARRWLFAALNNGVPVMLWTRTRCAAASHDDCDGHRTLGALAGAVAGERPGDLPWLAMALRKKALTAPKDEPHVGRDLTLMWDDPSRLPDPPLAMEV